MMKKQLLLLALNLFSIGFFAQNLQWAKSMSGSGIDEGMSVVTDGSGNIYTTGIFNGTVDFDPGVGTYNLTSVGISDIFISKVDGAGNFVWAKSIGSTDYDYGNAITLDAAGNVLVTGYFSFTADFDPGPGVYNLSVVSQYDVFILKLDTSGNFIWAKSFGGTSLDEGMSIATDATGNVYTTGGFLGSVDFDPSAAIFSVNGGGSQCAFISKLDPSGNFVFAKSMTGTGGMGRGLTIDAAGNIYSTGNFNGTVDFDPDAGVANLSVVGANDIYVSKLNSLGNFVWAKSIGSTTWDYGYAIEVDGAGNVYTTGTYGAVADFDPGIGISNLTNAGGNDIFVLKLDGSGNYIWAKGIGSSGGDFGSSIKLDGSGNLYVAGSFAATVDFNPGAATNNLISNGGDDAYILKLDGNGNYIWAQNIGSTNMDRYRDIAVDGGNNLCTTGGFFGTVDFDPAAPVVNLTSAGSSDIFISKISCTPSPAGSITGPTLACQGTSGNYSIAPVTGATGYYWTVSGGTIINSGQNTTSINVTHASTSNQIVVTPTNSCGSSPSVSLSVIIANSPTITSSASPNLICSGGTSTLSASGPLLLDQQSTTGVSTGFWMSLSGQQSFVAGLTGVLKKVRLHTATYGSAASITVKIYSGPVGGGSLLTSVSYGKGTNINSWDDVILPGGGVSVSSGSSYYIEILGGSQVDWIYRNIDVYANGQTWRGGTSYTYDYNFETYIDQNSYVWNPGGAPTQNFVVSPPSTTNYTVTVTNAAGCSNTQMVTLNVNPVINANSVITNVSCNGGANGVVDLNVTGGTTPYVYSWSNGAITQDIINLFPGVYNVTVTDFNGCTMASGGTVTQPPLLNASSAITTSINCNGGTGVVSVSASGGTPSYSGTGTFTVTAGTYTYNVTDVNGCLKTTSITVTQPAPLTINVNASSTICAGTTVTLTATGASTYTWNPGGLTGASIVVSPVSTTVYTVIGTSSVGCTATNTTGITVNPNPTVTVSSSTICVGSAATLTASGATTYSWNTGATTSSIVVTPGTTTNYVVTGTNGFGCVNTKTTSVTVNPLPSISASSSPTAICVGATATLTGTGANTYTWNPGVLTGSTVTVSPGTNTQYTVTGVNANGCSNTQTANLSVTALPSITASASSSTICAGSSVTLTGGGASTYTWSPGAITGSVVLVSPGSTTQYTVTGTNASGCTNTQTLNLTVNPLPTITASVSPASICEGSTATLTANGAATYTWNPGGLTGTATVVSPVSTTIYTVTGTSVNNCVNTKTLSLTVNPLPTLSITSSPATICVGATATLTGTGATTYTWNPGVLTGSTVTVSPSSSTVYTLTGINGNGCVNTRTINLTVNPLPNLTAVASPTAVCVGSAATLSGTGASTYTWNPGSLTGSVTAVSPGSNTQYTLSGTNGFGCINTKTLNLTVNTLPVISASASSTAICAGETATLTVTGANTYLWDSGASTNVISVTPSSFTIYTVTGTDGNNCSNTETVSITVNSLPTVVAVSSSSSICAGQTASLTASGASSYLWNTGASTSVILVSPASSAIYTVTGTSGNNCVNTQTVSLIVNSLPVVTATASPFVICAGETVTLTAGGASSYVWNTGSTSSVTNVNPGSSTVYTVTGTDSNSCINTETVAITVNPLPLVSAVTSSSVICAGDTATLSAGGANSYLWDNGATGSVISVSPTSSVIYTVTGTDVNGCVATQTVGITVNTNPVITAVSSSFATCAGETTTLTANGAATYTWNPGALTGSVVSVSPTTATVYTVTGIDGAGCINTTSLALTVNQSPAITASSSSSFICSGASVTLTGSGANNYTWSPGSLNSGSVSVSPTSSTVYTLTGENASGCVSTATLDITVGLLPGVITSGSSSVICAGGTATLTASGANSYTWNPGGSIGSTVGVSASSTTVYTVTGTDINGCENTSTYSLSVNALPVILISPSNPTICSGQSIALTASGANTYTWTGSGSTLNPNTVSPTSSTTYSITGTDGNGCVSSASTFVNVAGSTVLSINSPSTNVCFGYTMTVVASGATNYLWSNGAVTNSTVIQPFSNSIYSVIGDNGGTCSDTAYLSITVLPLPTVSASASTSLSCTGQTISLNATGNAVSYLWEPNTLFGANQNVQINSPTTYTVYGQGSNGCAFFSTVNVDVQNGTSVIPVTSPGFICIGDSAVLSVIGGSVPSWSNNPSPNTFVVAPIVGTTYTYTATDFNGCSSDIAFTVDINSGCDVVVYNGFTPNGDGINDSWLVDNIEKFPNNKVYIYNRWGTKIFDTVNYNNADNNWDGKFNGNVVDSGTYFYIIMDESEKLLRKGWIEITN